MWQRYRHIIVTIVIALLAAFSTYFTTIAGLKIDLASKAEGSYVNSLDKRISSLEVRLAGNFATKEDFFKLKEELLLRLSRIEARLNHKEISFENR